METSIQSFINMCQWDTANFFIFSNNVFAPLIYYSHFFALMPSFLIGLVIFLKDRKSLTNKILFFITTMFSVWVFADLVLWANEKPELIMFFWSLQVIIEPIIYAACVYFIYVFITKKDTGLGIKIGIAVFLLPTLLFASTKLALTGFDLTNCYRETAEGPLTLYGYGIEIVYLFWVLFIAFNKSWNKSRKEKIQIFLISAGIILFLLSLSSGNIIGSLTENWTIAQAGLFGMPIFVAFLAYMIVKFKTFNIKLIGAQALVFALGFLVLAILFIRKIENIRVVVIFTLLFVIALGYALVKSVKKEIEAKEREKLQHEKFEELAGRFENINHILAHDVKNTLGKNKDIFIETLAGTFGEITDQGKSFFKRLAVDTTDLIVSVTNILKAGDKIKPDPKPFDLKQAVLEVVESVKDTANTKGLKIETQIDESQDYKVNADRSLIVQHVLKNLIENAVNYNIQNGSIGINLSKKDPKTVLLVVKDSGHGMSEETKKKLFTAGGHGEDSIKFNVHTSGYGLLIARQTMDAHNGRVDGNSEGVGKGSTFFMELPIDFTPIISEAPKK